MPGRSPQTTIGGGANSRKGALASARKRRCVYEQPLIPQLFVLCRVPPIHPRTGGHGVLFSCSSHVWLV